MFQKRVGKGLGFLILFGAAVTLLLFAKMTYAWAGEDISVLRAQAEKGDDAAQINLGVLYEKGQGVSQDYGKAAHWFRLAANQRNSAAKYHIGELYSNGQGVPQDYGKAAHWFRSAAYDGNVQAQYFLGLLYNTGQGVPKDYGKAAKWYHYAAHEGDAEAQSNLGVLYANGQGVLQDYEEAYKWFILSKAGGGVTAKKEIDSLMPHMTSDQIAEGQRLAREWTVKAQKDLLRGIPTDLLWNPIDRDQKSASSAPPSPDLSEIEIKNMLEAQNQEDGFLKSGKERPEKFAPHYVSLVDRPDFRLPKHSNWYAVVVGVEQYPKGIPPAEFSDRDAQAVKANLIAMGYPESHIRLLKDEQATNSRIKATLKRWLPRNVPQGGRVLFYFAGHGGTDMTSKTAYLVPFDGDPEDLADTALSVGEVEREIGNLPLSHGIIVADACFSGAGGRSVLAKGARPLTTVLRTPFKTPYRNLTVFGASRRNQISGDLPKEGHGIFTYYFLRGLEGKAKAGNAVTPKSLERYLARTVPLAFQHHYDSGEQNPVVSGDFKGSLVKY